MAEFSQLKCKEKTNIVLHVVLCALAVAILFSMSFYFVWNLLPFASSILTSYPKSAQEVVSKTELEHTFTAFLKKFHKKYDTEEYHRRFEIFKESMSEIEKLNREHHGIAKFGWTKFADLTPEEFESTMLMDPYFIRRVDDFNRSCDTQQKVKKPMRSRKFKELPRKFDWRHERGVVGPVLEQRHCRSCWAHSIVGVMESMLVIDKLAQYSRFSIEELLQCSNYTKKCTGGNVVLALQYLCDFSLAIVPEKEYPLKNEIRGVCKLKDRPKKGLKLSYYMIKNDVDPEDIAWAVATHGPVVAAVNAKPWHFYLDGVIRYHCSGEWEALKHVVQIVGYDLTGPEPHFILRNSWGADFGNDGYVYTAATDFVCGIGRQIAVLAAVVV